MPKNVARFEVLAYISIAIGVITSALEYQRFSTMANPAFILLVQLFVFLIFVLFIWLIARRRKNWARWLFLILFLLGLPFYIPSLAAMIKNNPISGLLSVVQMLIQGAAIFLVFSGDAKEWFRKRQNGQA
jgi:peptidoglycan/LPS O-acetylase OafA/YrhL